MCHFLLQLNVLVLKQKKVMILFTNAVVLLQHIYSWLVAQKSHITSAYYFLPVRFLDMTRNREAVRLKIRYSETRLKLESRQSRQAMHSAGRRKHHSASSIAQCALRTPFRPFLCMRYCAMFHAAHLYSVCVSGCGLLKSWLRC